VSLPQPNRAAAAAPALRLARDEDAQDLFGLLALCFAEYPGCLVDPHDDLADLRAPASCFSDPGAFYVLEDDRSRICACVAVDFPEPVAAELHRLYVRPDQRRRGLGALLVRHVEDVARARGAARLFFWSDTRFVTAHRLYAAMGYAQAEGERELGDISGSREYRFEKALD
jgi:putative acetyltransferase